MRGAIIEPASSDDGNVAGHPIDGGEPSLQQTVLRDPSVQALVLSRFATVLGLSTLTYGAMVYLATVGAPQLTISLMGATRYLAALIFGIAGGALADAMSKRTAMVTAYVLQAAACFIVPTVWGTDVPSLIFLIFLIAMLSQIVVPALKAMTALVTTAAQVAAVAALITVASGIGSAMGTAFLAPILINATSMRVLIYVTGVVLLFGAVRTLKLPREEESTPLLAAAREVDWRSSVPTLRRTAEWLNVNRKVGAMILVGAMIFALFDGLSTLIPVYVRDVLGVDPTLSVFVFAPGGIGFLAGSVLGPWLMDRRGERALVVIAMTLLSLGFMLFGLIDLVAPLLAPFSPLRLLGLFGIELSPLIQAAGLISIVTALGSTTGGAAVQTYINRYVILARQPATFGMQEVLESGLTLFSVLTLGAIATLLGSRIVFVVAPPLIVAIVLYLIRICFRITAQDPPEARAILRALFDTTRPAAPYDPSRN